MLDIATYCSSFPQLFPELGQELPWKVVAEAHFIISRQLQKLGSEYIIQDNVAIHQSATVENHVVLKGPVIINACCFVGANAYLRGGVYLGENVSIGPGCEVKSSFILPNSGLAHFNFVGDSIVGSMVNMEAGSIVANHYNEREDKFIEVVINGKRIATGVQKWGALVGDYSKIGANAVLSPGTILLPRTIVKRLELI